MKEVAIEKVELNNESYYKISNSNLMRPFFMSIVSDSNHWMFISSNGGLTAGRKDASYAIFPYYTDDKITATSELTGSKTILKIWRDGVSNLWEPFSFRDEDRYHFTRNLYKNKYGNRILFEEINHDLEVSFRYEWCSSNNYGFIRRSRVTNLSENEVSISLIDGIQNILPYGVPTDLQNTGSNLVDAYKRCELHEKSGLGIFALSAIIVDKAEPSEALKANTVWSLGLDNPTYLLSSQQLKQFRKDQPIVQENDIKGEKGAYFLNSEAQLSGFGQKEWIIVANVNQNHSGIAQLIHDINTDNELYQKVTANIELGTKKLIAINASADGVQCTDDQLRDARHFSNVLFNNMRGGIFDDNYKIEKWDYINYLKNASKEAYSNNRDLVNNLPEDLTLNELRHQVRSTHDTDLRRLTIEYLPLKFSRRHGDPSRPWNRFSINMINEEDGSRILDYEGNWRDIFQNWEALVHSFPDFIEGMIFRFLNATTFDGYNPYRITKGGFDWETIEPDDPWSYIGYWGDHQIIYLLKFLEFIEKHKPGRLDDYFEEEVFVYANVPYKIKPYADILTNPKDTIDFDEQADHEIRAAKEQVGADGTLLKDENGQIHKVNFIEKILATVLAKISNYVPEGGIWMNTQRPEWNDANNALVGNGISMVTLYYLRRFLSFFDDILNKSDLEEVKVSNEIMDFYKHVRTIFENHKELVDGTISDEARKNMLDQLGNAASDYRNHIYQQSFWGKKRTISISGLKGFVEDMLSHIDATIKANKRPDNLYHAYNLLTVESDNVSISYLSEMLEGQVAVLSSGYLSSEDALQVLDALKKSALFRDDQYSYLLYPNKDLPGFLEKNIISENLALSSELIQLLLKENNNQIIDKDIEGKLHFNGNFRNVNDLYDALPKLESEKYEMLVRKDKELLGEIFEKVFNHKEFTGRSGTFFGYEGLGSIYWHMVSKLLLAVQECSLKAIKENADPSIAGRLLEHFYEINEGIGVHKPPSLYGAFPTDPYSHTPAGKGAQQPGMTGQVKEDILSRFGELGVFVDQGKLYFFPCLLRKDEFLKSSKTFNYLDIDSELCKLELESGSLAFTYCQIPIIYKISTDNGLKLTFADGSTQNSDTLTLTPEQSNDVFGRSGQIKQIEVRIKESSLK